MISLIISPKNVAHMTADVLFWIFGWCRFLGFLGFLRAFGRLRNCFTGPEGRKHMKSSKICPVAPKFHIYPPGN